MKSYYKEPILAFSIGLPLLLAAILIGASVFAMSNINKKFKVKQAKYTKAQQAQQVIGVLEQKVAKNEAQLGKWQQIVDTETRGSFLEHWRTTEKQFSRLEFSSSPHSWINQPQGLGRNINQPSSQVDLQFSATYKSMQKALLDIETKLPHIQLDSFSMTTGQSNSKLNFATKYTVWTKN